MIWFKSTPEIKPIERTGKELGCPAITETGYYRLKNGKKAYIFEINRGHAEYPIEGVSYEDIDDWKKQYRCWSRIGFENTFYQGDNDIIAPWTEWDQNQLIDKRAERERP